MASTILKSLGIKNSHFLHIAGASTNDTTASNALQNINELNLYISSNCRATCEENISNINIIIAPGSQTGDINFTQRCTVNDINCAIDEMVNKSVQDILELASNMDISELGTQNIFGITKEGTTTISYDLRTGLKNNILQLISYQCTFETNQTIKDNYVYIGNDSSTGDISFSQNADMKNLECVNDVLAKNITYVTDTNSKPTYSIYNNYIVLLLFIIVFVVLIVIFILVISKDETINKQFMGKFPKIS